MSESPNQWVGQIVDGKFTLQQFLGGTNHSAVFLTHLPGGSEQVAALKLIQVAAASADLQLTRWRAAAQLAHPNFLRIFAQGCCAVSRMNFLYIVTEHAPEDLSQILAHRALTADETREMLQPVLGALACLHEKRLVHGHVSPANILAIDDQVKLSVDSIFPAGEARIDSRELDIYDAPEMAQSSVNESADVWSLGTTLVEVLTHKVPARQDALQLDPLFPQDLPEPFLEIVRRSLPLDPTRRWTVASIAAHLNPKPALAAAAGENSTPIRAASTTSPVKAAVPPPPPLAVPLSRVAPMPAAKLPEPKSYGVKAMAGPPRTTSSGARFVLPTIAAVIFFAALFALPKFLSHKTDTSASLAPAEPKRGAAPVATAKSDLKLAQPKAPATSGRVSPSAASAPHAPPVQSASKKERIDRTASVSPSQPAGAATSTSSAKIPVTTPREKTGASGLARGEVLDQILPPVSDKARATIHGKVRVAVRVHVDASGNVAEAEFDAAGPSKYFADLALQAARKWEFTSPEVDGHSVPSIWRIRFEFTSADSKAYPSQEAP